MLIANLNYSADRRLREIGNWRLAIRNNLT